MSNQQTSLSLKVENFVSGIVRFVGRYARTVFVAVVRPWSFNINVPSARRRRRIVPPLTFLIIGCFLFSVIIDTYAEGWMVYLNWIWLDEEISGKINERGADIFSLTAIVRSGLPTFLSFVVFAQVITWLFSRNHWFRPRVTAIIIYAFGLHAMAFAIACFLPVFGIYALNPETSDSVISNLWQYGIAYAVLALTAGFAIAAFVSPILLLAWSVQPREARLPMKFAPVRFVAAVPVFLTTIFLASEFGSLPARFTGALTQLPRVDYQVMQGPNLVGTGPGDVSGANLSIYLHNRTEDLAYVDAGASLLTVSVFLPDGTELGFNESPKTAVTDENRKQRQFLPIAPGTAELVHFRTTWTLDGDLGSPTDTGFDGDLSYDGVTVVLDVDPIQGADLDGELKYEMESPTVRVLSKN
ncbi:hypothetical protein AB1K42_25465 [Roseibium algicola]|uniref:hypothetical protein n=1 Tax=Roseibium algicola TaxID=2857014 RepID=UPI00345AC097